MDETRELLNHRGTQYGAFETQAERSQQFKEILHAAPNWESFPPYVKEALEMVVHKIARLLNGSPYFIDSYRDIVGYTQLVMDILKEDSRASDVKVEYINNCEPASEPQLRPNQGYAFYAGRHVNQGNFDASNRD